MLKHLGRCVAWLSLILLLVGTSFAQFNGSVQGTVTDQAGAVIAKANISLRNVDTGVQVATTSNESGIYRFSSIAPGSYTVTIEAQGFTKREIKVQVTTNGTTPADAKLTVAGTTQEVVVTTEVTGINTEETRTQATLSTREVAELPLMNRSLLSLAVVTPGVTGVNKNERRDSFENGTPEINANGRPSSSNLFMVDGMGVMSTNSRGDVDLMPSPDMVQEATFQATTFSVENGAQSSLQADFTTKSGSNKFHGDFDYTFSSKALAATRDFQAKQTPFKRVYESGAFGGPIFKDKTFFFGSFQNKFWQMSDSGLANYITKEFADWGYNAFQSRSMQFYSATPPSRMAPTGKVVATGRDVNADCGTALANMLPCDMPVLLEGNSLQTPKQNGIQYNFRLDHNIREGKDRFYINFFRVDSNMDWLAFDRPGYDTKNYIISSFLNTNWTHQFTPTMLNFANLSFVRNWTGSAGGDYVVAPWGGVVFSPFYMLWNSYPLGPTDAREHSYTFRDYVSILKGRHNLKIGGHVYRPDIWQYNKSYARTASVNFLSMWDFARDVVFMESYWNISAQTGKYQPQIYGSKNYQYGVFLQDDWKVSPTLLLSLGIRMDDFGNPSNYGKDALPYVAVFPGEGATLQGQISNTYTRFVDNAFNHRQKGNFMPRAGFNWNPKGGKTVVRGGIGYYMDSVTPAEVTANLPTQPPNRISIDAAPWNSTQPIYNPWGTSTLPPYGFEQPNIGTPVINARGGVDGLQAGLNGIDYNLRTLKTLNWNFAVEQQLPAKMVVSAIYSGNHSWDQYYQFDFNHLANHVTTTDVFGAIKYTVNGKKSNYNALIGTVRQSWKNVQWQATYTWSHALDMPSDVDNGDSSHDRVIDGYNIAKYYANAEFDVRQRFALSGLFTLPTFTRNAAAAKLIGGWQLGTIFAAQSGTPFNIYTDGTDYNLDGTTWDVPNYSGSLAASGYSKSQFKNGLFPTSAFTVPADGTQGNMPRNFFRNPGFMSLDTSLTKKTTVPWFGEQKATLAFRVEAINSFNRVNLYPVVGNLNDSNFAKSVKAYNGRYIQLGARFEF